MSFRRAAKKDLNQTEIVTELRKFGYDVDIVHQLKNLYDLVVSGVKHNIYGSSEISGLRVEVKQPGERLSEGEETYWKKQNHKSNLIIAECSGDILRWFNDFINLREHKQSCEVCSKE